MDIEKIKQQLLADREVIGLISARAYDVYRERGEQDGSAAEDWLRAETEVLSSLVEQIVEQNRQALEAGDATDPVVQHAAEHARNQMPQDKIASRSIAEQSIQSQSTRMAADESTIPDTAALAEKLGLDAAAPARTSERRKSVGGDDRAAEVAPSDPKAKKVASARKPAVKKVAAKPVAKKGAAKTTPKKPPASA